MLSSSQTSSPFSTVSVFVGALLIRLGMLAVGAWIDRASSTVKYTDIDYFVFSDAARFLSDGGSPYERDTYRYTPFLAYLLLPNLWLHPAWGKVLFVIFDLLVGFLIMKISSQYKVANNTPLKIQPMNGFSSFFAASPPVLYASFWLYNPLVINCSTRGSADSLVSALVLATVLLVQQNRPILAAAFHGAAVHFKVYPIIFSFSYLAALPESDTDGEGQDLTPIGSWRSVWPFSTRKRLLFSVVSALTFLGLTLAAYALSGHPYLSQGLLYHLTRTDNRHNFSPWFYAIYLDFQDEERRRLLGLAAFLPQLLLLASTSLTLGPRDLPFCVAVQTMAFVAFNKVCTAQYFAWYFSVLPAAGPSLASLPSSLPLFLGVAWLLALGAWLACAYLLEFQGRNTFFATWISSLVFLCVNVGLLAWLLEAWGRVEGGIMPAALSREDGITRAREGGGGLRPRRKRERIPVSSERR